MAEVDTDLLDITNLLNPPAEWTPNNTDVLLKKLQELVKNINWSPEGVAELFVTLLKRFESKTKTDRSGLLFWMMKMLSSIEINYITPSWRCQNGKTVMELVQDPTLTDEKLQNCLNDDREKTLDEILEEIQQQTLNQIDEKVLRDIKDIVSAVNENLPSLNDESEKSKMAKYLRRLCVVVKKCKRYRPRLTQMVSWCLMALSKRGRLLQIATGEGKSCIVAMFAAFRALNGQKVDIMSSSSVLAQRDFNDWKDFYDALEITVSCNTNKHASELKKCYGSQIVYGTVDEFAADWLRQHFKKMDILGQREYQCAIVDEVDSLMLDKGHHTVYIGSDMPALQHLNPLLARIWATANSYTSIGSGEFVGQKRLFHQVILENIPARKDRDKFTILQLAEDAGILPKGSARKKTSLVAEMSATVSVTQLAEFFRTVERRFQSSPVALYCTGEGGLEEINAPPQNENEDRKKVLLSNGGFCQYIYSDEESVISAAEEEIRGFLHFTPCELNQGQNSCHIPGFLQGLVNAKLKIWVKNAFHANTMTKDHEYILETHGVLPVDYSCTGVVENFMKWGDGLHQFLEMKHLGKLSDMTAITNYMSNVGMLQMYRDQIYGVTGTLGQGAEIDTLQRIYEGVTTCHIPTFKRRKLFEVEGVVVDHEEQWLDKICSVVNAQVCPTMYRSERSVLVICETIGRANRVHDALGNTVEKKKLYINNNMDNEELFSKKMEPGHVIISTNLAGRGTDLGVSDQVKAAGGLFVVQTFLPNNARVEAQAFGRTARQGSPGCAQLIVCSDHLPSHQQHRNSSHILSNKNSVSRIKLIKNNRDCHVAKELDSYLCYHIPNIKKKGELFNHYLQILGDLYTSSNNKPSESDVSALNEFWGMWLLTNFNEDDSALDLKTKLMADLQMARQKLRRRESPLANLHHYTLYGNELRNRGHHEHSIKMYTKAIQQDKCWAAIAYYNRAFESLAWRGRQWDPKCFDQASEDLENALSSVELYREQIKITQGFTKQPVEDQLNGHRSRFDCQQEVRNRVLLCFMENIQEAKNKVQEARKNGRNIKMMKLPVEVLAPLVSLLNASLLSLRSVSVLLSRDQLMMHRLISNPSFDFIIELKSLESLGLTHVYILTTEFTLRGHFASVFSKV